MEEPCFLLACQRNVTASSVQGQTGECSLQLSITPGAGRDTHRELSVFSFIYLFLFSPFYVSSISRSLPYFVAFPASPSFVTFLSYRTCQHLSSARRFYTNTWIFSNNFSSSLFSLLYAVCINIQPNPERGRDSACTSITHMQPPDHPHSSCHTHTIKQTGTHVLKLTNTHPININNTLFHFRVYKPSRLQHRSEDFLFDLSWMENEAEREKCKTKSCHHLNCSALRLFNFIISLNFKKPECYVLFSLKLSCWLAGQAAPTHGSSVGSSGDDNGPACLSAV